MSPDFAPILRAHTDLSLGQEYAESQKVTVAITYDVKDLYTPGIQKVGLHRHKNDNGNTAYDSHGNVIYDMDRTPKHW